MRRTRNEPLIVILLLDVIVRHSRLTRKAADVSAIEQICRVGYFLRRITHQLTNQGIPLCDRHGGIHFGHHCLCGRNDLIVIRDTS